MQGLLTTTSNSNLNQFMGWKVAALTYYMVAAISCLEHLKTVIYFLNIMGQFEQEF